MTSRDLDFRSIAEKAAHTEDPCRIQVSLSLGGPQRYVLYLCMLIIIRF